MRANPFWAPACGGLRRGTVSPLRGRRLAGSGSLSKRRSWILGLLGAFAVILIGVLILFDWNWLRGTIESQVSGRLGRPFRINGDLEAELSLQPRIIVESAELPNAPWGSDAPLARIDRVEVAVDLLELLQGEIGLPQVRITKPDRKR
jgi:AsmA family protein